MQNKILDTFCPRTGRDIVVDDVKLYYLSIYDKIKHMMQNSKIYDVILREKSRKF